ncbi:hypothetical protein [Pelomicrobium methylotrophicum]|uniref:Uncharacterized protein n=1 Tax=Pelomicrobium methylotrophicum TaxID=2602750 RepID=A0A5C7EP09_9PROT|nr:hypothetical protein [Pelomicrobium methylotrophicum]TXF13595.1 hypothetical protein FR698_00285 [Pelomicrobium methylotrophicum]
MGLGTLESLEQTILLELFVLGGRCLVSACFVRCQCAELQPLLSAGLLCDGRAAAGAFSVARWNRRVPLQWDLLWQAWLGAGGKVIVFGLV